MFRVGAIVSSAALAALGLTAVGVPAADAVPTPPVEVGGEITCTIAPGFVKITPGLLATETNGPGTVTIKGKLSACTNGEGGAAPGGITGGKVTGSFTVTETTCNGEVFDDEFPLAYTIKWKVAPGSPKAANTVVEPRSSSFSGTVNSAGFHGFNLSLPGLGRDLGGVVTGSFRTTDTQELNMESAADTAARCTPKTPGIPGSGGLKKVMVETTSNLELLNH